MNVTKGLIVSEPWIDYLLDGTKSWEMRSSGASFRGWFGLIRKGAGAVYGVARLVEVRRALSIDELLASRDKHRIPAEMILSGAVAKWTTPWVIEDVYRLPRPVQYVHPNGAVTWVRLDTDATEEISLQVRDHRELEKHSKVVSVSNQTDAGASRDAQNANHNQALAVKRASEFIGTGDGMLIGQVELTQGNIDHNHIYLRSFFDCFPADSIGGSNKNERAPQEVVIDWGGEHPVTTDLDGSKRFFRARGWVRSFFEHNGAQLGDTVMVYKTNSYSFRIRLKPRSTVAL